MNKKTLGQVFTPNWVVVEILDLIGYKGKNILCRHVMDNSCGDGAFLAVVVRRYCEAWKIYSGKSTLPDWDVLLRKELENYIHGIDIDPECCKACTANLDAVSAEYGVSGVKWNIVCGDALEISERMYDRCPEVYAKLEEMRFGEGKNIQTERKVKKFFDFVNTHGRLPKHSVKEEKSLYVWCGEVWRNNYDLAEKFPEVLAKIDELKGQK